MVERHNHSIYIDHYPKGRDATVTAGGKNLRFKNDTDHYIWIRGNSDGVTTTFNIYGTDDGRKVSYTTSDFYNVVGRTTVTVDNPKLPAGTKNVLTGGQSGKQLNCVRVVKLPRRHRDPQGQVRQHLPDGAPDSGSGNGVDHHDDETVHDHYNRRNDVDHRAAHHHDDGSEHRHHRLLERVVALPRAGAAQQASAALDFAAILHPFAALLAHYRADGPAG